MQKLFKKAMTIGLSLALVLGLFHGDNTKSTVYAAEDTITLTDTDLAAAYSETSVNRVSVHDPSVVYDGVGTYYIFGSHMAWAKSTDLKNWTSFTNNINNNFETIFSDNFTWAAMGDSVYVPSGNLWAPDVIYNPTLGKWCMYMSINGCSWNSSIAMLTADNLDGNWTYVGTVIYSGFTDASNNHDFTYTDYTSVTGDSLLPDRYIQSPYTCKDGNVTTATTTWKRGTGAHAIDPSVFFGENGKLYMTYGSWSGGIYIIELDATTGLRDTSIAYDYVANSSDPYMGIKLAGGYQTSGEAPYIEFIDGYYYMFITNGGLVANGGYNMRVYRSENPTGPYTDISGQTPLYTTATNNTNSDVGTRLMSYYKWNYQKYAQVAQGHNSAIVGPDGKAYLVYHTRSNDGTEGHSVRVHQMFTTENHYLVAAPFEYNGETISETGYTSSEVIGTYEVIIQNPNIDYSNLKYCAGAEIVLHGDGTITGAYTGNWSMVDGKPYCNLTVDGVSYEGLFVEQTMEGIGVNTMAFTAVSSNDVCIWGAKYPSAAAAIAMTKNSITIATNVFSEKITLPTTGSYGTTISWSSGSPTIIKNDGTVVPPNEDTTVTLTATISKDNYIYHKTFHVFVHKAISNYDEIQLIKSAFIGDPQDLSTRLNGSLSIVNPYLGITEIDYLRGVKIKFDVEPNGTNRVLATIISFMANEGASGRLYFTPGSYLGYNATGGYFDANLHNWGIVNDYIGASKSTIEISFTATGFEVDVNGVKAYDQAITGNSSAGSGTLTAYSNVINWLTKTADKVYFGKGSWWSAATYDEALCTISDVYFYAYISDPGEEPEAPEEVNYNYDEMNLLASAFINDPQALSTRLDGSLSISNPYLGSTNIDYTKGVVIKFDIEPTDTNRVLATIISFMANEGADGRLYFTPGSYLGYNATGGFFDANLYDYKMVTDYIGSSKATIEIRFTSLGFEVVVNGYKAYDQNIVSNPLAGKGTLTDYTNVLDWLTKTADKVFFGKGSWWAGTGFDEALCKISNVYFYANIIKKDISTTHVTLQRTEYTYDGTAKKPGVTVSDGMSILVQDTDYTVVYSNNTNVGNATATITGIGNYTGIVSKSFVIVPAQTVTQPPITAPTRSISEFTAALDISSYIYDGAPKTPSVSIKDGTLTLNSGADYTVEYTDNTNVGTATVTITGKGNYTGTMTLTFTISKQPISQLVATLDKSTYSYTGKLIKPSVTVANNKTLLVNGTDYTVAYYYNKRLGTATVTITGIGNFTGSIKKTFIIQLPAPKASVSSEGKTATVTWNKVTGVTGYVVYMSTSKNGTFSKIYATNSSTFSIKKHGLSLNNTYYFKVVAYVKNGSTKTFSDANSIISVKIK